MDPADRHEPHRPGAGPSGPIASATTVLFDWLSGAGVRARLAPPGTGTAEPGSVYVWPVGLLAEQAVRDTTGRGPLRLRVRYLLTADPLAADPLAADPAAERPDASHGAAELLDRVLLASLTEGPVNLAIEPVPARVWQAFGLAPRLGLYAEVATRATRPRPAPVRVRQPLQVDTRPLGRVHGRVLGPGGTPVPGIRVVVADTGAATYTDHRGRFAFPALPAGRTARLLLSGKGLELVADVAAPTDEPVIIHCELEEV